MLQGKTIVIGVAGGIAVYKVVEVVSRLVKLGADVHVVMTASAANFVQPLTFREISGNPVHTSMWEEPKLWNVEHIELARRADLFLIAPATANIIGKIANGIADDFLSTTVMATQAPVILAPAMNTQMYLNAATQHNIQVLVGRGYEFIEPASGMLACKTEGIGRLPEAVQIVDVVVSYFGRERCLDGLRVLVTAGGTREAIDPVRYIGNRSSGKMGFALAAAAARLGAEVTLISGPVALETPPGVERVRVESAQQMRDAVLALFPQTDIVIKAAAVADYRPELAADQKIKKNSDIMTLQLVKNPDILAELGRNKRANQFLVGFAAETQELMSNALDKLQRKNLDMLIANDVTLPGAGFESDTNIVRLLYKEGYTEELPQMGKTELAKVILLRVAEKYCQKK